MILYSPKELDTLLTNADNLADVQHLADYINEHKRDYPLIILTYIREQVKVLVDKYI